MKFDVGTDDEIKKMANKYLNDYNIANEPINKKTRQIDTQKYMYQQMKEKGIENTDVERLLEFVIEDCQKQYILKTGIETKTGFIVALWSAICLFIMDKNIIAELWKFISADNIGMELGAVFLIGMLVISLFGSLFLMFKILSKRKYYRLRFEDKDYLMRKAVDDKEISISQEVDAYLNLWKKNDSVITDMSNQLDILLYFMFAFISISFISYFLLLFM